MNKIKLICILLKLAQSTNLFRNAHLTSKNECYNYCLKNKETFPQLNCFKFLRLGNHGVFFQEFLFKKNLKLPNSFEEKIEKFSKIPKI